MSKQRILIQFDGDSHASSFDAVVAIDAQVEHLLQYSAVAVSDVRNLVHGAIFTRGVADLKHTAIFVGGSDVENSEEIAAQVEKSFFGPMRVSMMLDPNGANTTAAAAVLCATRHIQGPELKAMVLAATGPVGQRVCRLLDKCGAASIVACSRSQNRAEQLLKDLNLKGATEAVGFDDANRFQETLRQCNAIISCGAAGFELLDSATINSLGECRLAIDLNAVPPVGLSGIDPVDHAVQRGARIDYGAIGVGGLKMKIHKQAVARLFESNDQRFDAEELYEIGQEISETT